MFVCICNAFNDKAVQIHLDEAAARKAPVKIIEIYKACSGGQKPECGICCQTALKDMVDAHNKVFGPSQG